MREEMISRLASNFTGYTYSDPIANITIKPTLRLAGKCRLQVIGIGKQRIYKSDTKFKTPAAFWMFRIGSSQLDFSSASM